MITKDEQNKLRSTIALLSSMVNSGEQHSEQSRKEMNEALSIVNNLPIQRVSDMVCCDRCGKEIKPMYMCLDCLDVEMAKSKTGYSTLCGVIIMKKRKYEVSKTIDYQMLDSKEILGKKIVDIYLHTDCDGDELQLLLEDGKQIEICLLDCGKIHVQSD